MEDIKKSNSIMKKIIVLILLMIVILGIQNVSNADGPYKTAVEVEKTWGTTEPNMPANNIGGTTGMFPQYWLGTSGRYVNLDASRLSWNYKNTWKGSISGDIVYCAERGAYVRYGNYDPQTHYLIPGATTIQDANLDVSGTPVGTTLNALVSAFTELFRETITSGKYYYRSYYDGNAASSKDTISITISKNFPGGEDAIGYFITGAKIDKLKDVSKVYYDENNNIDDAEAESNYNLKSLFMQLGKHIAPEKYSSDIDNSNYVSPTITGTQGPEVVVLERSNNANDRYEKIGGGSYSNDQKAYVLTALENAYDANGNYAGEYSLNDIQTAYWLSLGQNPGGKATEKGRTLYEYSVDYANFVAETSGGYNASINSSLAQVIVDRNNQTYIVGPFSINYPDYTEQDISYIKSLSINNGKLIYDENHEDFKIILENEGTTSPGANGMQKKYPKSGEKFFIQFSASSINYATNINFNAQFEYINGTTIDYETLDTLAHIYKYYGYSTISSDSEYQMSQGSVTIEITYLEGYTDTESYNPHEVPDYDEYGNDLGTSHTEYDHRTVYKNRLVPDTFVFTVWQPYIKMGEEPESEASAQTLTIAKDGERIYKIESRDVAIDLSMELGGHVWEDGQAGKESVYNGIEDTGETRIPNVIVTLSDGQTTKTDENGEYRFSGLNAMYQYSVTFTYNGQYYQPTTFAGADTWGSSNWLTNSNAKDNESERTQFNLKFESIGSSPENYTGSAGANKTYTKEELLNAGVIDEFGNLIGGSGSMAQYVKDCMMKAYTFDLYPYPSLFVIDNKPVTREYVAAFHNQPAQLYDDAYYINLGLVHREQSDLAVKKDVDHVTLEINGQTHTYTYDTLENKENAEKEWDISVRLSDAYYNAAYSRELYKSDYIYKASMYGDEDKNGDGIGDTFGKSKEDELEVYITYKIMVRNQAMSIRARVDELVDYYDTDLEYIDERSYIEIKQSRENAAQKGIYSVKASANSKYSSKTITKISGYDNLYITGLANLSNNDNNNYLAAGQTAYVYLTFKVKKDTIDGEDWVKLDEEIESGNAIGVGKENIVEVNGYSTQYAKGTKVPNVGDVSFKPAGIVDRDSNSGNLNPSDVPKDGNINYGNFEDDTDKAPNIRIILYRDDDATRVISGSVWEDERTESIDATTTGDGIRDDKDKTLINGVTVQLVELMENGTEYVWREFGSPAATLGQEIGGTNTIGKGTGSGTISSETPIINYKNLVQNYTFENNHNGTYAFKSFMPGKYVVRFIYGDTIRTVTPASLNVGGLNTKSYNGQDYKSTTYQEGITQNKTYAWREQSTWNLGQETLGKILTEVSTFKADASNNETTTLPQKDANGNFETITADKQKGYLYDITASDAKNNVSDAKDIESRRNQVIDYSDNDVTNYIAEVLASHKVDYETMNDRTQLLNDLMANTKMTAETGLMVIELEYDRTGTADQVVNNKASYKINNVDLGLEERPKAQLAIDKEVTNVKLTLADGSILFDAKNTASNVLWRDHKAYSVGYTGNFMDEEKFGSIQNIRSKNASKFGLIQLTMDEELMHGATIEVTYQVTVSNVGEVDYKDNLFYYTGNKSANAQVVTTSANQVLDYVANNLQFNKQNNEAWNVIEKDAIKSQGLVNTKLDKQVEKFNTIIVTEKLSQQLVPNLYKEKVDKNAQDSTSVPLVLTQLITSENDSDDLTYRNIVEIVKTSNLVGRRMEYSVVGNQDPEKAPQELDSDIAEVVRILPPFGNAGLYIIMTAVALVAIAIIVGGTIFIKKKVLRK